MEKRWVKRKMNKALTMITLTSTMALMSPMIVQTGSIVYAVSQDQATILADTEVGKLAYTYQTNETNINWSLSVDEKSAAESAYLRLKIDGIDTINVAGQSIGKDETGWFVLDAATSGINAYQVDFATINNGSQELPIAAELITPGEEGVEDQVQSLVTDGLLKAEVPVVTELPEVETSSTDPQENILSNESSERDKEVSTDDQTQEEPVADIVSDTGIQEQTVGDQTANTDVEIMPLAVNNNMSHGITANGNSILDTRPGTPTTLPENSAEAGQEITFTSTYSADGYGARDCNWTATIDTSLFSISGPISLDWVVRNSKGTVQGSGTISKTFDGTGTISSSMDSLKANYSLTYTFKLKVKNSISTDIRSPLVTKVTSQGNPNGITKTGYYWIKGDPITVTNGIKNVSGSDILVGEKENLGTKYANTDEKIEFTSTFTQPEKNSSYEWQATLHTGTIDTTKRIRVYRQIGNSSKEDVTEEVSVNRNILTHNDEDANFSGEKITYWIEGITASTIDDGGVKGNIISEVSCDVYKSTDTDYYWVKGNFYTLRNEITKENGDDLITFDAEIGESYANPSDRIVLYSKFTLLPNIYKNVQYQYKWSAKLDLDTIDVKVGETVRIQRKVGDKWNTVTDVIIKTGGVIEYTIGSSSSDTNYHYRIVSTENKNLMIHPNSKFDIDTKGTFSSSLSHQKRTWNSKWGDWGRWSDDSTPHSKTNNYWVKAAVDNPTILSWEDEEVVITYVDPTTYDIADLSEGYSGSFYWTDEDEDDDITFGISGDIEKTVIFTTDKTDSNKVNFVIPFDLFDYGDNEFTIEAFNSKGETVSHEALTLTVTTEGRVKLVSVPENLSWTGRTIDETAAEGAVLNRDDRDAQKMTLAVRDSREQRRHTWKLTVNTIAAVDSQPYNLIWRNGVTDTVLSSASSKVLTVEDIPSINNTWNCSREYSISEGILLKPKQAIPVGDHSVAAGVKWSLNDTP